MKKFMVRLGWGLVFGVEVGVALVVFLLLQDLMTSVGY